MTAWFTSDHHFHHKNIIRFSGRPFVDLLEMHWKMIKSWNDKVLPGDTVYHLGDFSFSREVQHWVSLVSQLNGQIHLIKGNHDSSKIMKKVDHLFASCSSYKEVKIADEDAPGGKQMIVLCHYAFRVWNKCHHGSWHLYGHSHGSLADSGNKSFDVGVDANNYAPLSYGDVKQKMAMREYAALDHHGRRD